MQQNWFIRYKLYHIPFWVVYNYLFWAFQIGSLSVATHEYFFSVFFAKCFFYNLFSAFAVCFNLYFLIPRYLQKGRYGWYLVLLALTIMVSALLIVPGYGVTAWLAGSTAKKMFGLGDWSSFYHVAREEPLKSVVGAVTLGMSIKLAKNWIETQRRHRALEKEKLETELKFLKYQFNPHFLFNSINSIFFLIHKNPDMASASLAKFSDLLRYQIYECDDSYISLEKEIAYLQNFIELEKLRQSKLDVNLLIDCPDPAELMLPPFILITFVENAFKHVSRHSDLPNRIDIRLQAEGQQLHFFVANSAEPADTRQAVKYSGIGLKNVKRRLDLIYPGKYDLNIKDENGRFEVELKLGLTTYAFELNNAPV